MTLTIHGSGAACANRPFSDARIGVAASNRTDENPFIIIEMAYLELVLNKKKQRALGWLTTTGSDRNSGEHVSELG
jgi:hypothetical protein